MLWAKAQELPLVYSASAVGRSFLIQLLLSWGLNPNQRGKQLGLPVAAKKAQTPLQAAVWLEGSLSSVQALVQGGAVIEGCDLSPVLWKAIRDPQVRAYLDEKCVALYTATNKKSH